MTQGKVLTLSTPKELILAKLEKIKTVYAVMDCGLVELVDLYIAKVNMLPDDVPNFIGNHTQSIYTEYRRRVLSESSLAAYANWRLFNFCWDELLAYGKVEFAKLF